MTFVAASATERYDLSPFWHRTRKTFVPLTADDYERRSGGDDRNNLYRMSAVGLIRGSQCKPGGSTFQLTAKGKRQLEKDLGL